MQIEGDIKIMKGAVGRVSLPGNVGGVLQKEIRSTKLLTELYLYRACRQRKGDYRKNTELYKRCLERGF